MSVMEEPEPELEVVGHKTEKNELEDFWMARVESLEKQYDDHIVKLEKKLFDDRFHSRVFASVASEKDQLADELKRSSKKCQTLNAKVKGLGGQVEQLSKQKSKIQRDLVKTQSEKTDLLETFQSQHISFKKIAKDKTRLSQKLGQVEQEKKKLVHDVSVRENELRQWRERDYRESREPRLPQIALDILEKAKKDDVKVHQQVNRLIQQGRTREEKLIQIRRHLEEATQEMKEGVEQAERQHAAEKMRLQNYLTSAQEDLSQAMTKLDLQKQNTEQWREEVQFRNARLKSEATRNEVSALRGQVATLSGQLKGLERDRERFLEDRSKLVLRLQGLGSLEKSLAQLIRDNVQTRNHILKRVNTQDGNLPILNKRCHKNDMVYGYEKKINRLEKRMKDLEGQLISTRRRENSLRWTLQKQSSALISQINWTDKAKFKMDAQNRESERLCNAWARQIAQKKVTGHQSEESLDRQAKERILQRRLAAQTSKLEKLKAQFHFSTQRRPTLSDVHQETWKWNNFVQSSIAESVRSNESGISETQKRYMEHLGESISLLGKEITTLEKKQAILSPTKKIEEEESNGKQDDNENGTGDPGASLDRVESNELSPTPSEGEEEAEDESIISSSSSPHSSSHSQSTKDS